MRPLTCQDMLQSRFATRTASGFTVQQLLDILLELRFFLLPCWQRPLAPLLHKANANVVAACTNDRPCPVFRDITCKCDCMVQLQSLRLKFLCGSLHKRQTAHASPICQDLKASPKERLQKFCQHSCRLRNVYVTCTCHDEI